MSMVCMVESNIKNESLIIQEFEPKDLGEAEQDWRSLVCEKKAEIFDTTDMGYHGTLDWTPTMQSKLLAANFYGGIITIVFSGYLADIFGAKFLLLFALIDCSIVSFASPPLAETSYALFFISRIVMGLGEGFVIPCMSSLASNWYPAHERSTIAAIYTSGNQLAGTIGLLISSKLCGFDFLGWRLIFYLFGFLGLLLSILWYIFCSDTPENNKWISDDEKQFLINEVSGQIPRSVGGKVNSATVEWKCLFMSLPLWANFLAQFSFNFGSSLLQGFLPSYLKEVLLLPLNHNGLFVVIPYLAQLISKNIFGVVSDSLKKRKILSSTALCKMFQCFGNFGCAGAFLVLAFFVDCTSKGLAIIALIFYGIAFSCGISGFYTSIISIAPSITGLITSISMIFGMLGNAAAPNVFALINKDGDPQSYTQMFIIVGVINIVAGIFYFFAASGEIQPWAVIKSQRRIASTTNQANIKLRTSVKRPRRISEVTASEASVS
uniref:MFS domain-containing protein n=1 Tax=Rhabditophanes sp. KR3021 TaxID=114890 RepID=A0AC35UIN2_9BILA